ncbi:hypothetical protein E4T43_08679 [Aureobasidium subglaciale]|nr:hypothetical protein E4T43_08679 [Aureobasidium subglaciale]
MSLPAVNDCKDLRKPGHTEFVCTVPGPLASEEVGITIAASMVHPGDAINKKEAAEALDSLLLADEVWDACDIGSAKEWPETLQSIAPFVFTLSHPAAIFWGEKLVMIYNGAWEATSHSALKQGRPPTDAFPKDTVDILRDYIQGCISRPIVASELSDHPSTSIEKSPVVCSPIHDQGKIAGVLVQIFNKTHSNSNEAKEGASKEEKQQKEASPGEDMNDLVHHEETALDRQPFFQKFAEMLPTGLAILDHKADPLFVNHQFHDLTAHRGPDQSFRMWPETIHPDDYERVMEEYHSAFDSQTDLETEFRAFGENQWRLFLMRPLGKNNLQQFTLRQFGGYICALIDVSDMKNAELAQTRAAKEARERKQQQERFIDMISHEIRNPLSAVLHCAENIMEAVRDGKAKSTEDISVDEIVEAVSTIQLCVDHQKNLVDDVLSFSKLDASMLTLAPRATKPKVQMADTLKIFQPELRKKKVEFGYTVRPEYDNCNVDWVMADLVRISQVIVNLMTNAIKFTTKSERKKKIDIEVAASIERPTSYPPNVVFFKTDNIGLKTDATGNAEWGDGEPLYIMVAVKDTGIGISKENQSKLFERFQQATPKTGQMYGGSGLGLNIARKMCQLHGGEIGVSSVEGEGSTFGFFFRVRRGGEPEDSDKLGPKELSRKLEQSGHVDKIKVDEDKMPEDLSNVSGKSTGTNSEDPPKDRWQHTADMADQMSQKHKDSNAPRDQDEKSSTRAEDDVGQRRQNRPANAGRSSHRPDASFEKTEPANPKDEDRKDDNQEFSHNKTGPKGEDFAKRDKEEAKKPVDQVSNPQSDSRPTILFVEDNLINQKLVKKKIEAKGFQVTTADNGKEALDLITARSSEHKPPFDCILMDQEMPVMDGKTASREIRKFEDENDLPNVNIIGVTANVREEQQSEMTEAGMNDVIAKPFRMEDLLEKVRRGSK